MDRTKTRGKASKKWGNEMRDGKKIDQGREREWKSRQYVLKFMYDKVQEGKCRHGSMQSKLNNPRKGLIPYEETEKTSTAKITHHDQFNLQKGRFIWAPGPEGEDVHHHRGGEAEQQAGVVTEAAS